MYRKVKCSISNVNSPILQNTYFEVQWNANAWINVKSKCVSKKIDACTLVKTCVWKVLESYFCMCTFTTIIAHLWCNAYHFRIASTHSCRTHYLKFSKANIAMHLHFTHIYSSWPHQKTFYTMRELSLKFQRV